MNGKFLLEIINYFFMWLIFLFGLLSLVLRDLQRKLVFLFLMFLSFGILSFLFFTGPTFIIIGMIMVAFFVMLYLSSFSDMKVMGQTTGNKIKKMGKPVKRIINLALSIIFCGGLGYLFYFYTLSHVRNYNQVTNITIVSFPGIISEIGNNYSVTVMVLISVIAITVLWFINILDKGNKN
ncbi:MAG: hypothetical protein M1409_03465 [Actinobacteria bacterium]|nr:hypothetical protein [Actinomycetota bacterium]